MHHLDVLGLLVRLPVLVAMQASNLLSQLLLTVGVVQVAASEMDSVTLWLAPPHETHLLYPLLYASALSAGSSYNVDIAIHTVSWDLGARSIIMFLSRCAPLPARQPPPTVASDSLFCLLEVSHQEYHIILAVRPYDFIGVIWKSVFVASLHTRRYPIHHHHLLQCW